MARDSVPHRRLLHLHTPLDPGAPRAVFSSRLGPARRSQQLYILIIARVDAWVPRSQLSSPCATTPSQSRNGWTVPQFDECGRTLPQGGRRSARPSHIQSRVHYPRCYHQLSTGPHQRIYIQAGRLLALLQAMLGHLHDDRSAQTLVAESLSRRSSTSAYDGERPQP